MLWLKHVHYPSYVIRRTIKKRLLFAEILAVPVACIWPLHPVCSVLAQLHLPGMSSAECPLSFSNQACIKEINTANAKKKKKKTAFIFAVDRQLLLHTKPDRCGLLASGWEKRSILIRGRRGVRVFFSSRQKVLKTFKVALSSSIYDIRSFLSYWPFPTWDSAKWKLNKSYPYKNI